jgi:3-dehydroquinate dehydratase type I
MLDEPDVTSQQLSKIREAGLESIVTLRPTWEGGLFGGSEGERCRILSRALKAGPDYIDIELGMMTDHSMGLRKESRKLGVGIIISHHDWEGTPSENVIACRIDKCTDAGADISKVVVRSGSLKDFITLLDMGSRIGGNELRYSLMGTGPFGHLSRIFSREIGSEMVYCSIGEPVVEGQISLKDLKTIWKHGNGGYGYG